MAKFLTTSAINYYLEQMIKETQERLIIISPFLKFNDRIKELLEDKDRMKIDVRIVYGKNELAPTEINWLSSLEFVRTSFCQHLHAKCYANEHAAIITSMNLYDFSQQNNNEMGVYIDRETEPELYRETYDEAQRLIRVSDQVRLAAEKVHEPKPAEEYDKLPTSKLARQLGVSTADLLNRLVAVGLLEMDGAQHRISDAGKAAGGEFKFSKRHGAYYLWPRDLKV